MPHETEPWKELFRKVAVALKCLPSDFIDGNGHVLKKAESLMAPLPAGVGEAGRNSKRPHIPQHLRAERVQGEEETNLRCDGPDDHGGYVFKVTQHGATSDENKELGQELAHRWNAARSALAPLGTTGTTEGDAGLIELLEDAGEALVSASDFIFKKHGLTNPARKQVLAKIKAVLLSRPPAPTPVVEGYDKDAAENLRMAEGMISRIEAMFPNWQSYRDLEECIEVTLHHLRSP